jgi:hypothetical protein
MNLFRIFLFLLFVRIANTYLEINTKKSSTPQVYQVMNPKNRINDQFC